MIVAVVSHARMLLFVMLLVLERVSIQVFGSTLQDYCTVERAVPASRTPGQAFGKRWVVELLGGTANDRDPLPSTHSCT